MYKKGTTAIAIGLCMMVSAFGQTIRPVPPLPLKQVKVRDAFWQPRYAVWNTKTVNDVLDKLEGKYEPDREDLIKEKEQIHATRYAFINFDRVAKGDVKTGGSYGPPWYDGLVYETIRGAADLLVSYPDARLEKKLDSYIDRIALAQAQDSGNPREWLCSHQQNLEEGR